MTRPRSGALVVAIDGPSGSGKSTISRGVATALGLPVLDTGAMYRAVAYAVVRAGIDAHDPEAAAAVARSVVIAVDRGVTTLDGEDISTIIRGPDVTALVSVVAAHPPVRADLVRRQRAWVDQHGGGVVEGRDIGSVVFPDARVKVFLTASDDERARRRQRDEVAADREVSVADVQAAMARRDAADSTRRVSPLRSADGALHIDTTGRSPDDIVAEIVTAFAATEGAT
ncbi:MAG: (d)CMP kinase [Acidimicrobiia bacterium]|nr:(d)CMP kinase [Acidimicrobiia bacterium]